MSAGETWAYDSKFLLREPKAFKVDDLYILHLVDFKEVDKLSDRRHMTLFEKIWKINRQIKRQIARVMYDWSATYLDQCCHLRASKCHNPTWSFSLVFWPDAPRSLQIWPRVPYRDAFTGSLSYWGCSTPGCKWEMSPLRQANFSEARQRRWFLGPQRLLP